MVLLSSGQVRPVQAGNSRCRWNHLLDNVSGTVPGGLTASMNRVLPPGPGSAGIMRCGFRSLRFNYSLSGLALLRLCRRH